MIRPTFTPTGNGIAVIYEPAEQMTAGGLVVPESVRQKPSAPLAKVVAVGPECKQVKPGDVLLFDPAGALCLKFEHGGVHYHYVKESDVIGVAIV